SWLDEDENYLADLAEKRRLITEHRGKVFAEMPESRAAQRDILKLITTELAEAHPGVMAPAPAFKDDAPLLAAAELVQEDLVLMRKSETHPGEYYLAAAAVCFPTGWNLTEKVGKVMRAIHHPVPDLNAAIGNPIDRFFRNLKPGKKVERFNWGLYDSAQLFQPGWWRDSRPLDDSISAGTVGEKIIFRVERQTLQRLPDSSDILFTIRIFNTKLHEVCAEKARAQRLAHAIHTMPEAMKDYKSLPRYLTLIEDYVGAAAA
ncbi:MAG: DUF3445 domain-containing protein, partial [Alphaproteobacteria bacterium]